jgi:tRNA pseudouridine synthase 10
VRDKLVEWIKIVPQNLTDGKASLLTIDLKTSAGTYVKEFVHGDDGRTKPSLSSLLDCNSAKCISLDVLEIFLDWPPRLE